MSQTMIEAAEKTSSCTGPLDLPLGFFVGERTEITQEESIAERWRDIVRGIRDEYLDPTHRFPWVVGFSGGKDSTVVAHGVFEALLSIPPSQRARDVHIVSNDTMVESPLVIAQRTRVLPPAKAAPARYGRLVSPM